MSLRKLACTVLSGGNDVIASRMCEGGGDISRLESLAPYAAKLVDTGLSSTRWAEELRQIRAALACSLFDFDALSFNEEEHTQWLTMNTGDLLQRPLDHKLLTAAQALVKPLRAQLEKVGEPFPQELNREISHFRHEQNELTEPVEFLIGVGSLYALLHYWLGDESKNTIGYDIDHPAYVNRQ